MVIGKCELLILTFLFLKETYYIPRIKKSNPKGKLFSFINNKTQKTRSNIKQELARISPAETPAEDPQVGAAISWLGINTSPWETVLAQWRASFPARKHLLKNINKSDQVISSYPHLRLEYGYQLVSEMF